MFSSSRTSAILVLLAACGGMTSSKDAGDDGASDAAPSAPAAPQQLACGLRRACVLRRDGSVDCWGEEVLDPRPPPFTQITAGVPVCGLRPDGELTCWGWGTAEAVTPVGPYKRISVSWQIACALDKSDVLTCWRWNGGGGSIPIPTPAEPLQFFVAGGNPCGLLKSNGFPICWGQDAPAMAPQEPLESIAAGNGWACGVRMDSTLTCWGKANNGETSFPPGASFVEVKTEGIGVSVCAKRVDGTIACWGGFGLEQKPLSPTGTFRDFCVGDSYACGIRSDDTIACWGLNTFGQASPP